MIICLLMIEIKSSLIAGLLGWNIVIYPFVLYDGEPTPEIIRHEHCHVEQIKRDGMILFYTNYVYEFAVNYYKTKDYYESYSRISYEVEAVACEETGVETLPEGAWSNSPIRSEDIL